MYIVLCVCGCYAVQVTYNVTKKAMSVGCVSAEPDVSNNSSCLSQFAGKYANELCEYCCMGEPYCNGLKTLDTIAADCLKLSSGVTVYNVYLVWSTLLALLVASSVIIR